jgi:hypothetical protein
MKRILLSLMIAVLALPPIGGAQEPKSILQDKQATSPQKPREPLPVRDKRDIEDRKAEAEYLRKTGTSEDYIYELQSQPRFLEVKGDTAVEGQYIVTFTAAAEKNLKGEIERISSKYQANVTRRIDSPGNQLIFVECTAEMAKQISEDLSIRRVEQNQVAPKIRHDGIDVQIPEKDRSFLKGSHYNGDWALDLIDNRFGASDNYYNSTNNAAGTWTYIVDGGVVDAPGSFHFSPATRIKWLPGQTPNTTNGGTHHGTMVASMFGSYYRSTHK